jgi:hypothetical protein
MQNKNLNGGSISQLENLKDQKIETGDVKFIRSVLEKACRQVKPKTSNSVMWGLTCMIIYSGIHFLIKNHLFNWIRPFQISLIALAILWSIIQAHFVFKKYKQEGFVPQLVSSALYGIVLISFPVFLFDMIGLFKGMYCGSAFIYALLINAWLVIVGMLHSKLWFTGTIFIITGILTAFVIKEYSFIILGVATGAGIIFPALMVDLNYRKQEIENV